jgi:hypothetical protein
VVEGVERQMAGYRDAERLVVERIDDLDRDSVQAKVPEEGDFKAVLIAVREFAETRRAT